MTNEEAIVVLQKIKPIPYRGDSKSTTHILETIALDMAIKALEQQPCEDCISRQVVINAVCAWGTKKERNSELMITMAEVKQSIADILANLPSVTPKAEQKAILDKIRAEIENHCGLIKEDHCKYCGYCNSVMGVREILEIIDKYKVESEDKE